MLNKLKILLIIGLLSCSNKKETELDKYAGGTTHKTMNVIELLNNFHCTSDTNYFELFVYRFNPFNRSSYQYIHLFETGMGEIIVQLSDSINISDHEEYFHLNQGEMNVKISLLSRRATVNEIKVCKQIRHKLLHGSIKPRTYGRHGGRMLGFAYCNRGVAEYLEYSEKEIVMLKNLYLDINEIAAILQ